MKLYNKIIILALVTTPALLMGCLKDKDYNDGVTQSLRSQGDQKIVSIGITAYSTVNFKQFSLKDTTVLQSIDIVPITLGGSSTPATEDIHVDVTLNPALIGNYNALNGTSHEDAPTAIYTIANPAATGGGYVVTIPKGSYTGFLTIKLIPHNFIGHDYALGVQLSKVETSGYLVSANAGTGVVAIGVKNKYDAIYKLRIKTTGWGAYSIADGTTGDYADPFYFITAGSNSNTFLNPTSGFADLQPALTPAGGETGFGATTPVFVFDPATDSLLSVSNTSPDDGRGRKLKKNDTVRGSKFDPATKKIYLAYIMSQNGRPDQFIYDTLTYVDQRP